MHRHASYLVLVLSTGTAFAASPKSFDWPQWRGPNRDAVSKEEGLLKEWSKDGPPLAWKTKELGGGYSAPSIAAGRIYGMSYRGGDEIVWALSETGGKPVWATRVGATISQRMPQGKEGSGCTPTVDGEKLYVLGMGGDLTCLRVKDGKTVWQHSLTKEFGGRAPMWSYRESPLVDGNKVICTPGGQDAILVALDKSTGKTIWKSKLPESTDQSSGGGRGGRGGRDGFGPGGGGSGGAAYASAIAIDFEGQRQYVQLTAKTLVGFAASDGKFLWRYDRPSNGMGINCSTPIYHEGLAFAASAYGAGGGLVKLTKDANGGIKAEEVYFTEDMQNHHGGMVILDGCLYGANGGNEGGYLVCLDFKTGKVLWDEEERGKRRAPKGSVALAEGRLYYRTEQGTMLLIEANPKEYVERGRFEQPDRSRQPAWAHPVIANGKLYLRDQDVLFCYDVKEK
jgi:outer membrane protein assembly factor BamB